MQKQETSLYTLGDIELRGFSDEHGNPLFIAADVAKALDYRDAANMIRLLDEWEIKGTHIVSTLGGEQSMTVITEAGIYHAVFASSKKEAMDANVDLSLSWEIDHEGLRPDRLAERLV